MRRIFLIVLLWQLFACSSMPEINRYTFARDIPPTAGGAAELSGGLGVGPIELPEYWRQKEIVVLSGDNRIISNPNHIWAGDPKLAISRTIATSLSQQLQFNDIWAHPWDSRSKPQKQILLIIESMGGPLGGPVELVAKWRLTDDFGMKVIATERQSFQVTTANKSYPAYVEALNQAVGQLADALESSVRRHFLN